MYLPAAKEKQNNNQGLISLSFGMDESQGQEKNKKNDGIPTARENNNKQTVEHISHLHKEKQKQ